MAANLKHIVLIFMLSASICLATSVLLANNVALSRPAWQSSTYYSVTQTVNPAATLAVDGCIDTDYFHGCCSCTDADTEPWWGVDLGAVFNWYAVSLTNRDLVAHRLRNLAIYGSNMSHDPGNATDKTVCAHYQGPVAASATERIQCEDLLTSRFVIVIKTNLATDSVSDWHLTLCELQVEACHTNLTDCLYCATSHNECSLCAAGYTLVDGACKHEYEGALALYWSANTVATVFIDGDFVAENDQPDQISSTIIPQNTHIVAFEVFVHEVNMGRFIAYYNNGLKTGDADLWKCTSMAEVITGNWATKWYDDSAWSTPLNLVTNAEAAVTFPELSSNSTWVWAAEREAQSVWCRHSLALHSPPDIDSLLSSKATLAAAGDYRVSLPLTKTHTNTRNKCIIRCLKTTLCMYINYKEPSIGEDENCHFADQLLGTSQSERADRGVGWNVYQLWGP